MQIYDMFIVNECLINDIACKCLYSFADEGASPKFVLKVHRWDGH